MNNSVLLKIEENNELGITVNKNKNGDEAIYIPYRLVELVKHGKQRLEQQQQQKDLEEQAAMAARKIAEMRLEKAKVARLLAQSQSSVGEMKGVDADEFATTSANEWLMSDPDLNICTDMSDTLTTLSLNNAFDFEHITDEGFETIGNAMNKQRTCPCTCM